jgi:transcriptional regulator with XRE-family HTH domain
MMEIPVPYRRLFPRLAMGDHENVIRFRTAALCWFDAAPGGPYDEQAPGRSWMQVRQDSRPAAESSTFGEILRRERQLRSITLREISATTKIGISHLEALERNDFAALPGGAFTKGFLRAYAVHVGLDPEEMVNHYLYEISGRSEMDVVGQRMVGDEESRRRRLMALAAGVILLLAAAALVSWWWLGGSPS